MGEGESWHLEGGLLPYFAENPLCILEPARKGRRQCLCASGGGESGGSGRAHRLQGQAVARRGRHTLPDRAKLWAGRPTGPVSLGPRGYCDGKVQAN